MLSLWELLLLSLLLLLSSAPTARGRETSPAAGKQPSLSCPVSVEGAQKGAGSAAGPTLNIEAESGSNNKLTLVA